MNEISLPSHVVFNIGQVGITNAELSAFAITFGFIIFSLLATRKMGIVPTRIQLILEMIIEYLLGQLEAAFGSKKMARRFFPMLMTMLLFITVANQFSLIPLVTLIVAEGDLKVFRVPTTDLTLTIGLALLVVIIANVLAITAAPLKYFGNFIRIEPFFKARSVGEFFRAGIDFFLGLLDIIGEFAKIASLSFRLFGNIFAGEVMIAVIAGLAVFTRFLVPIPFFALSIFSGLIQGFVFTLLATQYIASSIQTYRKEEFDNKPIKPSETALADSG